MVLRSHALGLVNFQITNGGYPNIFSRVRGSTDLFLLGALFRGYLGCLLSRSVLGRRKVGDVRIFFFLWLCTPFNTAFLAFKAFALASAFGGAGTERRKENGGAGFRNQSLLASRPIVSARGHTCISGSFEDITSLRSLKFFHHMHDSRGNLGYDEKETSNDQTLDT